ncbi:hypothetical protein [uncultured Sphingomonas sp.]|uniref:hypothetical protein n=1 Tax=uncultured Sphingomonas sp. TaxID=158754 RepID=UPI0025D85D9C|nr:hypothetical protein [uncultured Sphingomonas sp.]
MTATATLAIGENPFALEYKGHPISYTMLDGVPWFYLNDLLPAMNLNEHAIADVQGPSFPAHAKQTVEKVTEDGSETSIILSPVGVWFFGQLRYADRQQGISAWARREAKRLCPTPRPGDPAMFLTLNADKTLPPRPWRYSGWLSEWRDLKDKGEYLTPHMAFVLECADRDAAAMERFLQRRAEATKNAEEVSA